MAQIYSTLKYLRYHEQLKALEEKSVAAPVHIRIKPNNHCNHNCWYCAYRVDNLTLGEDIDLREQIPTDKMFEIVDDVVEMGVKAVTFSGGGEPLLYKPLPECIDRLAAGGVKVATLTNGSNLKGRMAEAFAQHGTWIRVSVDAWDDDSYAQARGIKDGAFSKLLENMRNFADMQSDCVLGISFIVGRDNHEHVYEAAEIFKEAGASHVKFSGAVVSNDGHANNLYHRELMDVVTEQIERSFSLNDDKFHIVNHYHELEERFDKEYTTCPFLQYLTVIGADCQVYTCQDKAYTEPGLLGSIKDRSFKEFWFSEENRRKLYALDPSKTCKHHCVSHAKNLSILEYLSLDPDHGAFV